MTVRVLQSDDEQVLKPFLSAHAETSMFLLSNLASAGIGNLDVPFGGAYWGIFDDRGTITGVAAHYANGNILMQAPDARSRSLLFNHVRSSVQRPVEGVLGPDDQVLDMTAALGLENADFTINHPEDLFHLPREAYQALSAPSLDTEVLHWKNADAKLMRSWLLDYRHEAMGQDGSDAVRSAIAGEVAKAAGIERFVLLVGGVPTCLAGFNARLEGLVQIGPVWTPPENRGRGYARYLLACMLGKAFADGVEKAILFTGRFHKARAYRAVGFIPIGSYRLAILRQPVDISET